jgi:hypothetical protein
MPLITIDDEKLREALYDYFRINMGQDGMLADERSLYLTRKIATLPEEVCEWKQDSGIWLTKCGRSWDFFIGGPADNDVKYCHHCGRPIREVRGE